MNLQVSAQAQERLLQSFWAMGLPRDAAATLLERHMVVRFRRVPTCSPRAHPPTWFLRADRSGQVHSSRAGSDRVLVDSRAGRPVGYAFSDGPRAIADVRRRGA